MPVTKCFYSSAVWLTYLGFMGEREGWVGVCVAACPAWRAEHLQKHDRMKGVPPSWMCVCVRAREDSIRDAWGSAFTAACAGSPRLCSMTGGTRCGQCLITFGTGQPELSPGLLGPCRHLCPGAFCPAWPLARVCVCARTKSGKISSIIIETA